VTTIPASNQSNPLLFKQGERIKFISDSNVAVYIQLDPKNFQPSEVDPQTGEVNVKNDTTGKKMINCGFVQVENGVLTGYGWLPINVRHIVAYEEGTLGIWGEG
jgi:hypothetical protein